MGARDQVFIDGVTSGSVALGLTITISITPAFPDEIGRMHLIAVENFDTNVTDHDIASVTVGGVAATLLKHQIGTVHAWLYTFKNPPKGTHNVVVTFNSGTTNGRATVYELEHVDPVASGVTASSAGTGTAVTCTLNPVKGITSVLVQNLGVLNSTTTTAATAQSPFASDDSTLVGVSPNRFRGNASSATAAGPSVDAKYTIGASKPYAQCAAEIQGEEICELLGMTGCGI